MDQHPHLVPPPPPPPSQSETSLPTFAKSIPVEIATLPASTRTSFTRVDNTRPGSSTTDQRDEMVTGPSVDSDGAPELPPPPPSQNDEQPEAAAPPPPPVPQVPQTLLQFLLVSGRRRSMAFEPETTVGRVKELVWNSWPNGTFQLSPSYHTHALSISRLPTPPGVILFFFIVVPSTERRFTSATPAISFYSHLSLFASLLPLFFPGGGTDVDFLLFDDHARLARRTPACSFLFACPISRQDSSGRRHAQTYVYLVTDFQGPS
jgi:hypothetical protein